MTSKNEAIWFDLIFAPKTKPVQSLVKVRGFGINHSKIFTRNGLSPNVHFPRILGIECVGEIAKTTDPKSLPIGQKVVSIMDEMERVFDGSYTTGTSDTKFSPNDSCKRGQMVTFLYRYSQKKK